MTALFFLWGGGLWIWINISEQRFIYLLERENLVKMRFKIFLIRRTFDTDFFPRNYRDNKTAVIGDADAGVCCHFVKVTGNWIHLKYISQATLLIHRHVAHGEGVAFAIIYWMIPHPK